MVRSRRQTGDKPMPDGFKVYCLGSHWGVYWVANPADREKLNRFAADKTKYSIHPLY